MVAVFDRSSSLGALDFPAGGSGSNGGGGGGSGKVRRLERSLSLDESFLRALELSDPSSSISSDGSDFVATPAALAPAPAVAADAAAAPDWSLGADLAQEIADLVNDDDDLF